MSVERFRVFMQRLDDSGGTGSNLEGMPRPKFDVEVRESTKISDQKGLFATRDFATGELVLSITGTVTPDRSIFTIELTHDRHLLPIVEDVPEAGLYMNHSCDPNTEPEIASVDENPKVNMWATRAINAGDELTFDYAKTESETTIDGHPCSCGSPNCRGKIYGSESIDG